MIYLTQYLMRSIPSLLASSRISSSLIGVSLRLLISSFHPCGTCWYTLFHMQWSYLVFYHMSCYVDLYLLECQPWFSKSLEDFGPASGLTGYVDRSSPVISICIRSYWIWQSFNVIILFHFEQLVFIDQGNNFWLFDFGGSFIGYLQFVPDFFCSFASWYLVIFFSTNCTSKQTYSMCISLDCLVLFFRDLKLSRSSMSAL